MATSLETPLGHSIPPQGPHTVTFHVPTWASAVRFRDGDTSLIGQLKSVYPRFLPFGPSAMMLKAVADKLLIPADHGLVPFLSPQVWPANQRHATSQRFRKDKAVAPEELRYHAVEIAGTRLYLVEFPAAKQMPASFMWQHGGVGFNTRLGEHLLARMDTFQPLGEFSADGAGAPPPTYLPEVESHALLRRRVADLLMRATVQQYDKSVESDDVYLYQSGMAGITRFHDVAMKVRPYPVAVFGAVFHSTWHLFEESPQGLKHYGKCDENDLNEFENYLEQGGKCSYVFTEFPSNPILVSVDLIRLRKLADQYGFWLVVDDTVSSFCNIDVLPVADVIITSLSKSFSGYADLLAGSTVLNPNQAAAYATLKPVYTESHHNEMFAGDANKLLNNSDDYLERSVTLNRNAAAMTAYFESLVADPKVPVRKVYYPPYVSIGSAAPLANLEPFRRRPTPEFPEPGHGCLFSVELEDERSTVAFYDNLAFHQGPHLGAHRTLAMVYNAMIYGGDDAPYHASYGLSHNQVRFSAGLEDEKELLDTCKRAVAAMLEAVV